MNFTCKTPNFAPDGMAGSRLWYPGQDFVDAAIASEAMCESVTATSIGRQTDDRYHHNQDGFDDGLVHSHGWAADDR